MLIYIREIWEMSPFVEKSLEAEQEGAAKGEVGRDYHGLEAREGSSRRSTVLNTTEQK